MRYTEMLELYKGYGETIKRLRDALEPIASYQRTLASDMSAWTAASNVSKLYSKQMASIIQNYSGVKMETLMSQADMIRDNYKDIARTLNSYSSIKEVVDNLYLSMDIDGTDTELETDFVDEQELQDAFEEEFTDKNKFAKRIKSWADEKIKKYNIYKIIVLFIINVFVMPYLEENVGKPVMTKVVSIVKKAPEKGAEIIYSLKDGVQAIIMENTNYYYKVKFTDDDGIEREGYVAKKNLKVIKQEMEHCEDNYMEEE